LQQRERKERTQSHQSKLEAHILLQEKILLRQKYSLVEFLNTLSNSFRQRIQIFNVHKPSQVSANLLQFQQMSHQNLHDTMGRLWTEPAAEKLGDPSHKALTPVFQLPSKLLITAHSVWTFGHKCCLS